MPSTEAPSGPGTTRRTVVQIPCLLPRAVGRDLIGPVEQLGVDAVGFDQSIEMI